MAHRVALRPDEFKARANALGIHGQSAQARAIGVAPSIHHRALTGERPPNALYALRLLQLVGSDELREEIDALFHIDLDESVQAAS
ncbi:MAG TPA: hypothetical protein VMZ00_08995 [Sporichthya sp.]|nr:hypothetical protein [Sporichthya sp.]